MYWWDHAAKLLGKPGLQGCKLVGSGFVLEAEERNELLSKRSESASYMPAYDLDAAVFDAYGWPRDLTDEQILQKLVALNAERAAEEQRGIVRWLRPDFQNPTGARGATQVTITEPEAAEEEQPNLAPAETKPWPKKIPDQIAAVRDRITPLTGFFTVEEIAKAWKGAKKKDVADLLDSLAALGIVIAAEDQDGKRWRTAGRRARA
jgi:cell wall-associated NlpC family hydrolase